MRGPSPGGTVRTIAVIPARGGSKGLPRKNVRLIGEHPLIYYTIREAHAAHRVDATIVSTDDSEIAAIASSLGADIPFLRPPELAADNSRDLDYLRHALEWVERHRGWSPEFVVLLLPTSPSRTAQDIDEAIELLQKTNADSVRTVVSIPHVNAYKMWAAADAGRIRPVFEAGTQSLPRQSLPDCYLPVALAYVTRARLIRAGSMWGSDVRMIQVPLERFTDIDTEEDLNEAALTMSLYGLI